MSCTSEILSGINATSCDVIIICGTNKFAKKIFIFAGILVLTPFLVTSAMSAKSYLDGTNLRASADEIPSKYVFIFDQKRDVVISDEFNQFVRSWGASPDEIKIDDGIRTVIFREPAILKTNVDSVEPHEDYVKLKGWMGVKTKEHTKFIVDNEGVIAITK